MALKADDYYSRALTLDAERKKRIADDAAKMGRSMNAAGPVLSNTDKTAVATDYLLQQGQTPSSYKSMGEWNKAVADASGEAAKKFLYPLTDTGKSEARANAMATGLGAVESAKQMANTSLPEKVVKAGNWNERGIDTNIETGKVTGMATRTAPTAGGGGVFQVAGPYGYGSTTRSPEQTTAIAQQQADGQKRAAQFQQGLVNMRALAVRNEEGRVKAKADKQGTGIVYKEDGSIDRAKTEGAATAAKFAEWEGTAKAEEEGKAIQRESSIRAAGLRRQANKYGGRMTAEEWQANQDEQASLKQVAGRRQGLNTKGITEVGFSAQQGREERLKEQQRLRRESEERARAAGVGEAGAKAAKVAQSSTLSLMDSLIYPSNARQRYNP